MLKSINHFNFLPTKKRKSIRALCVKQVAVYSSFIFNDFVPAQPAKLININLLGNSELQNQANNKINSNIYYAS